MTEPFGTVGDPLSPREVQILNDVADGMTARRIGASHGLSPHTVRTYQARIRAKLGAGNQANAVKLGFEYGYLKPRERVSAP